MPDLIRVGAGWYPPGLIADASRGARNFHAIIGDPAPTQFPGVVVAENDQWTRPVGWTPPQSNPPQPPLPAGMPIYSYASLYRSGDTFATAVARMPQSGALLLPNGFDATTDIYDFTQATVYGCYGPSVMAVIGEGPTKSRIRFAAMSSTKGATIPAQSSGTVNQLVACRFGPGNSSTHPALIMYGFRLEGTDQMNDPLTGAPHCYGGLIDYYTAGAQYVWLEIVGFPGNWNSPPGETNQFNSYNSTGTVVDTMVVDGFNAAGEQVGAATGNNHAHNITYRNCIFRNSNASGLTFADCNGFTVQDSVILLNANHRLLAGGSTFPGINFERNVGPVVYERLTITMDGEVSGGGQRGWFEFANTQNEGDNKTVTIRDITAGSPASFPPWAKNSKGQGLPNLVIKPNYSGSSDGLNHFVTPPAWVQNGVTLTPVETSAVASADPNLNYVIKRS